MNKNTQATPEELYQIIKLVRPLYKTLEAAVAQELDATGISLSQRAVLEQIQDHGAVTVPAIGRSLILPRQFIQKIANELLDASLIERRENAAHKRSVLFVLTDDGRRVIDKIKAREAAIMAPIAKALCAEELTVAKTVMNDVIAAFDAHNTKITQGKEEEKT